MTSSIITRRPALGAARASIRTRASATAPGRCSICPSRSLSSSPNIVRTIADAPPAARRRGRRFPTASTRPCSTARIGAFVLYLLHYQLLPEKRLVELMADLLGVKLVTATIARISRTCPAPARLRRYGARSRRSGAGQAHGRDRLSDRRPGCAHEASAVAAPFMSNLTCRLKSLAVRLRDHHQCSTLDRPPLSSELKGDSAMDGRSHIAGARPPVRTMTPPSMAPSLASTRLFCRAPSSLSRSSSTPNYCASDPLPSVRAVSARPQPSLGSCYDIHTKTDMTTC